eukprot:PRCOL_00005912-RA
MLDPRAAAAPGGAAATTVAAGPPPSTTLYVGKIAPTVADALVTRLLALCGGVRSWKPTRDPATGKPKGFGFVEFVTPQACTRCVAALNGLEVDGRALLVKPNKATQAYLEHAAARRAADGLEPDESPGALAPTGLPQNIADLKAQVTAIVSATAKVVATAAAATARSDAQRLEQELMGGTGSAPPATPTSAVPAGTSAPAGAPAANPASAATPAPERTRAAAGEVAGAAESRLEAELSHGADRRRRERDSRGYADRLRRWEDRERSLAEKRERDLEYDARQLAERRTKMQKDESESADDAAMLRALAAKLRSESSRS